MTINNRLQFFFFAASAALVTVLFIPHGPARAQVLNVEKTRTDADTTGWAGEIGLELSLTKFNDRILEIGNEANAAYLSPKHAYLFLSSTDLVDVDGSPVVSNGYFHFRSTFFRRKRWSPEAFIQYQYNENLGLKNRALAGIGIRFGFLSAPGISGYLATGLMGEYEEWSEGSDSRSIENRFLKSTSNLVLRGELNPRTSLLLTGYYQARPDKFFEPRITSESQLNLQISNALTYKVDFTLVYDTEPVIHTPRITYELKNGLIISF